MPRSESSKTPLAGAGVFTTGTMQVGLSDSIVGSVFADQDGTVFVEQSGDGDNWDVSAQYVYSAAGGGRGLNEVALLPYVRVRYVNGATPQTAFRIFIHQSSAGPR